MYVSLSNKLSSFACFKSCVNRMPCFISYRFHPVMLLKFIYVLFYQNSFFFFFMAIYVVFQCMGMVNILQLTILDGHFDHILMLFYAIVKNTVSFSGRTSAEVFLGHFTALRMALSQNRK